MTSEITSVYTAGKSATTTTYASLEPYVRGRLHNIRRGSREGLREYLEFLRGTDASRPMRTTEREFADDMADQPNAEVRLISLTREPVAAAVSSWFFNFENRVLDAIADDWEPERHLDAIVNGEYASRADYFTGWFDFECRALTGIDVYDDPFSHQDGYRMYSDDRFSLLVIRSEDLNTCFKEAFKDFLDVDVEKLTDRNVGAEANYASAYARFKAEVAIPAEFVDRQLNSKFALHFYTDAERKIYRARWTGENP